MTKICRRLRETKDIGYAPFFMPNALEFQHILYRRSRRSRRNATGCPRQTNNTTSSRDAPLMTFLQFAVLVLGHFALLAAGFAPQSVVDVASSSSSSTALQAKRLPITMPTQTPMVPYRVS